MAHSIPQEIIEEIIGHLHHDLTTLRQCALAARPLHSASRRHMFATRRLYYPNDAHKLRRILEDTPDIAPLIRTLLVVARRDDIPLSSILPRLPHLLRLCIGHRQHRVVWDEIPRSVASALEDAIKLSTVRTLVLTNIYYLPVSTLLLAAAHVETLEVDTLTPYQLLALHQGPELTDPIYAKPVQYHSPAGPNGADPKTPHLRRVTFKGGTESHMVPIREIIAAGASSIEDVTWIGRRTQSIGVGLGAVSRLRRFTIMTGTILPGDTIAPIWDLLYNMLASASLGNLQELHVMMETESDLPIVPEPSGGIFLEAAGAWWLSLDALLMDPSRAPKLCVTNFTLNALGRHCPISNDAFSAMIEERLPLLRSAGILTTNLQHSWSADEQWSDAE